MIYLTPEEIEKYYGKANGGLSKDGRFNSEGKSYHWDTAYKYELGYIKGLCVYAIIQKKEGGKISLEEAHGLRTLSGKGSWKLNKALDPEKNAEELQKTLDDITKDLGFIYTAGADDRFKGELISVHQKRRVQLIVYHPIWRPDLSQIAKSPL